MAATVFADDTGFGVDLVLLVLRRVLTLGDGVDENEFCIVAEILEFVLTKPLDTGLKLPRGRTGSDSHGFVAIKLRLVGGWFCVAVRLVLEVPLFIADGDNLSAVFSAFTVLTQALVNIILRAWVRLDVGGLDVEAA